MTLAPPRHAHHPGTNPGPPAPGSHTDDTDGPPQSGAVDPSSSPPTAAAAAGGVPPGLLARPSLVVPVLAAVAGTGASVVACALADAAAAAGLAVVLADLAPPYRSGLGNAAPLGGLHPTGDPAVRLRDGRRPGAGGAGGAVLLRLESPDPELRDRFLGRHRIPSPVWWSAAAPGAAVLVVDVAWDALEELAVPGPAAAWLEAPPAPVRPVLVVGATEPAAARAEAILAALEPYGTPAPVLAVPRVRRLPPVLTRAAGPRLAALLPSAVPVPADGRLAVAGVRRDPLPAPVTAAGATLLQAVGALPATSSRKGHTKR
jgi:hypothetical protein